MRQMRSQGEIERDMHAAVEVGTARKVKRRGQHGTRGEVVGTDEDR
jgi:hypothetical protein